MELKIGLNVLPSPNAAFVLAIAPVPDIQLHIQCLIVYALTKVKCHLAIQVNKEKLKAGIQAL